MPRPRISIVLFTLVTACGIPGAEPPLASADSSEAGKGTKEIRTEERKVDAFERVFASGVLELKLTVGPKQSVTVTADGNLQQSVRTQTRGKALRVETLGDLKPSKPIRVTVAAPSLEEVRLEGGVAASIDGLSKPELDFLAQAAGTSTVTLGATRAKNVDVALSGTSKLDAKDLECRRFHVTLDGACSATAAGSADEVRVDADGTGRADLLGVAAKTVIAALNGSARAEVNVSESLRVRATGSAKLVYAGNPTKLDKDAQAPAEVSPK